MLNSNVSSFQTGVDTLYDKCKSCGSTPSAKTPAAISTSIQTIYTNRYNAGYAAAGGDVKHNVYVSLWVDGYNCAGGATLYVDGVAKTSASLGYTSSGNRSATSSTVSV